MLKIGILASTNGTDLPALFDAKISGAEFSCLLTNIENCGAREKAKKWGIPDFFITAKGRTREEFDREAVTLLREKEIDLVLLIGFMRILSPYFVENFPNAILNVHPSLLPAFAGGMDSDVHAEVLKKGCKVSGATVHFVSAAVDEGPIALQKCVPIAYGETAQSLKEKIQKVEQALLISAVKLFRDGGFEFIDHIVKIRS